MIDGFYLLSIRNSVSCIKCLKYSKILILNNSKKKGDFFIAETFCFFV